MPTQKPTPLVSVIIPTYNRAWCLLTAVNSVLAQEYRPQELIVVDDGSTDETASLLAHLIESGKIKYIHQENKGVSAARNCGITNSQGELIAFLDSDDEWLAGKTDAQVNYFHKNPTAVLVQSQEYWFRGGKRVNPRRHHQKRGGDIFLESLELCLISPSAVMLRRSLLDEIGLFDESLPAAEDYDLWLRILSKYPAGLIDEYLVIRRGGRTDQLSAAHSLDRWRCQSLSKLLKLDLSPERRTKVEEVLKRRREIYQAGLAKRLDCD